jgi:hypothetical protein
LWHPVPPYETEDTVTTDADLDDLLAALPLKSPREVYDEIEAARRAAELTPPPEATIIPPVYVAAAANINRIFNERSQQRAAVLRGRIETGIRDHVTAAHRAVRSLREKRDEAAQRRQAALVTSSRERAVHSDSRRRYFSARSVEAGSSIRLRMRSLTSSRAYGTWPSGPGEWDIPSPYGEGLTIETRVLFPVRGDECSSPR